MGQNRSFFRGKTALITGGLLTGIISVNDSGFAEKLKALFSEQQTGGMY